jgi:hypothetical protein
VWLSPNHEKSLLLRPRQYSRRPSRAGGYRGDIAGVILFLSIFMPKSTNVRLFFGTTDKTFQIFSVSQNANDGSIYFSAPQFAEIMWLIPASLGQQETVLLSYQASDQGKLSLHGSGVTHVRPYQSTNPNEFTIRGNQLKARAGDTLGVRHLLTIFPAEPTHKPNSPATARRTDCVMHTKEWHPLVFIFWAVPLMPSFRVNITGAFHSDDLQEIPPNSGWGAFGLGLHALIWFAYRTRHMDRWPKYSQASYADGHTVPLLIGTGPGRFRLEYRQPNYSLLNTDLTIAL